MWVLDLLWKRFYNMSPGDFESIFINVGNIETKEGLEIEETIGESLSRAALAL